MSHVQQLAEKFGDLAERQDRDSIEKLKSVLREKSSGMHEKHMVPLLACKALISKGKQGIEAMHDMLHDAPGSIIPLTILNSLFHASIGEYLPCLFNSDSGITSLHRPIEKDAQQAAKYKFLGFVEECKTNPQSFDNLLSLMTMIQIRTNHDEHANRRLHETIFSMLANSTLKVSDSLIHSFSNLLNSNAREEEYQTFLTDNPVFLNPLANKLISKHKLGDDFITDYILETLTGDYIAVEIEKPSDKIFTKTNNFSHQLTHAFGQVIDFIEWVEQNVSYAQRKLPNICSPKGLVIIGRRISLSQSQEDKLRRFNRNSNAIEVITFDDLLSRASTLQENIRHNFEFCVD